MGLTFAVFHFELMLKLKSYSWDKTVFPESLEKGTQIFPKFTQVLPKLIQVYPKLTQMLPKLNHTQ